MTKKAEEMARKMYEKAGWFPVQICANQTKNKSATTTTTTSTTTTTHTREQEDVEDVFDAPPPSEGQVSNKEDEESEENILDERMAQQREFVVVVVDTEGVFREGVLYLMNFHRAVLQFEEQNRLQKKASQGKYPHYVDVEGIRSFKRDFNFVYECSGPAFDKFKCRIDESCSSSSSWAPPPPPPNHTTTTTTRNHEDAENKRQEMTNGQKEFQGFGKEKRAQKLEMGF